MNELIQPGEPELKGVHAKIFAVMKNVEYLNQDDDVKFKGVKQYSYLSEEKVTTTIHDQMVKVGLIMFPCAIDYIPVIEKKEGFDSTGKAFKTELNTKTIVRITYKIVDPIDGSYEFIMSVGKGADSQDKDTNKAMTGAFKYAQRQMFFIPTGEDADKISSKQIDEEMDKELKKTFPGTTVKEGSPEPIKEGTTEPVKSETNPEQDKIIADLVAKTKNPETSQKLVDAFKGDIADLIEILKKR